MSDSPKIEDYKINKGALFLVGLAAYGLVWCAGVLANHLMVTTFNPLWIALPIFLGSLVAYFVHKIGKAYPGSSSIFGYVVNLSTIAVLSVFALTTLANQQSWLDGDVNYILIALVYPIVALGYDRCAEVFIEKLGLNDGGELYIKHVLAEKQEDHKPKIRVKKNEINVSGKDKVKIVAADKPRFDFSKAVSYKDEKGVSLVVIDFDELLKAKPIKEVEEKPVKKPAKKTVSKKKR